MNAGGACLFEGIERGMVEVCMDTPDRDELNFKFRGYAVERGWLSGGAHERT